MDDKELLERLRDVEVVASNLESVRVAARATAARAEHAEIVEALEEARELIWFDSADDEMVARIDALLTRITKDGKP